MKYMTKYEDLLEFLESATEREKELKDYNFIHNLWDRHNEGKELTNKQWYYLLGLTRKYDYWGLPKDADELSQYLDDENQKRLINLTTKGEA